MDFYVIVKKKGKKLQIIIIKEDYISKKLWEILIYSDLIKMMI